MNLYEAIDMFIAAIDPETFGIIDIEKFEKAEKAILEYEKFEKEKKDD